MPIMHVSLYFDPFQPFKDDANHSTTPFVMICNNVPGSLCWDAAYSICLGLVPGSRKKGGKVLPVHFPELAIDQLEYAQTVRIQVIFPMKGSAVFAIGTLISLFQNHIMKTSICP